MLPDANYARQLEYALADVGNDQAALTALLAALDRYIDLEDQEYAPTPDDYRELDDYLERLEYERDTNMRFV